MPLQCISASLSANIGQFTAPNGNDITGDSSLVTAGDATDPGYLSLNLQNSGSNSQGVHRCIIPDENGIQNYLFVGIYFGSFNGKFRHCCNDNWRASVASETLTGVTQSKIGDVCLFIYLFICIYVWTYVCHFVL